ncbi:hypothetical protein K435DRAFT_814253 [Dendrothele bispora CBS 962.96]|uniref:Uncharacterized protein n=1 Tax=Dendrothele bispora (strain CBS 962.96) TaxID=1314807 RepID=A0A4S8KJA7_DENBC|nr:hypothetical protein K435DRAFT_814253 [Dendrothele bispora CBS 962.96]
MTFNWRLLCFTLTFALFFLLFLDGQENTPLPSVPQVGIVFLKVLRLEPVVRKSCDDSRSHRSLTILIDFHQKFARDPREATLKKPKGVKQSSFQKHFDELIWM